jgi:hypothetical protein
MVIHSFQRLIFNQSLQDAGCVRIIQHIVPRDDGVEHCGLDMQVPDLFNVDMADKLESRQNESAQLTKEFHNKSVSLCSL